MRRASYANRKLTDEEQEIVKGKYKMVASFVKRNRLKPIDEWESYLAPYYILAIMKYTDYKHLHQYGIEAIIYQSLKSAKGNYYSKMYRSKRRPEGGFLYYDEQDGKDAYISGFMVDAITAVDCALWDIAGKHMGLPVYQLLGGAHRTEIPAYISGLPVEGLEEKVNLALSWKEQGFRAIKLHIGYGMDEDIRIMAALRKALGSDFTLMMDAHWNYDVSQAVKLARRLEDLGVEFLECPLNPEDYNGYAELSAAVDIPIALGESDRTHWQYKEILDKRSCDILQPDVGRCGITELMRIAELAELYGRPVAPHLSVGQGACIAATLQCDAALYNFYGMQEYQPSILPVANECLVKPIVCESGCLKLPDGPGLGIEPDEDKLQYYSMGEKQ